MAEEKQRATRDVWAKRVERWRDSGLTAPEFARELGINHRTLTYWKYVLKRDGQALRTRTRRATSSRKPPEAAASTFVTVEAQAPSEEHFELELSRGRRLRIPMGFDEVALRRLVTVLEAS